MSAFLPKLSSMQIAMFYVLCYIIICGLRVSTTFFAHYLINSTIFGEEVGGGELTEHKICISASYTMGTGSFPGLKHSGRGVDHPPPSSAEVEGRVELYICSPSGPSWPVLGRT